MQLKTNLKLGEVTNLGDARFAAGRGAQFVGFNLTPEHEKYISPGNVQEIAGWMDGPRLVGEWNNGLAETIWDTAERLQLDYIQLNWLELDFGNKLADWNIIQNFEISADLDTTIFIKQIELVQSYAEICMFTINDAIIQEQILANEELMKMLHSLCKDYPVLLNFDFTEDNLLTIIDEIRPFGINLKGDDEIKPGYKDYDALNNLVDLLEE